MDSKTIEEGVEDFELPIWLKDCPLVFDWCVYKGQVYFAALNYQESEQRQKPVFDLAYCATKAMNGIFLRKAVWGKNKFHPWNDLTTTWHHQSATAPR